MRRVFALGETLMDVIFKNHQPVAAKAGGSMLNAGVSLGRLNVPVFMLSEYGNDQTGDVVENFLKTNGISVEFTAKFEGRTSVALAFLNENNDATYTFFHEDVPERIRFATPDFSEEDLLIFGSLYSLIQPNRQKIREVVTKAHRAKTMLYYDPNFRQAYINDLEELKPEIFKNIQCADIVRGSNEDFLYIFGTEDPDETYKMIKKAGGSNLIITCNTKGVWVFTEGVRERFPVEEISTVSTIGAGDSFNAGVLYSIYSEQIKRRDLDVLSSEKWGKIISDGVAFASHVCQHLDNYISTNFADNIKLKQQR